MKKLKQISQKTIRKVQTVVATVMFSVWSLINKAYAEGEDVLAKQNWNKVMDFIWTWVPKIGAVVCAVGLIEFALAFKSEDADGKTRGLRTAIAGAMVIGAVATVKAMTKWDGIASA